MARDAPPEKQKRQERQERQRKQKSAARQRWDALQTELTRDRLPRRIFKCVLATTLTVIITLLPNIRHAYGAAAYMASITTVFGILLLLFLLPYTTDTPGVLGHPGRRLGSMVEALILAAIGACVGVAWASLATYLASFLNGSNVPAMLGIRAAFLTIALFVHGYVRSSIPRLFIMVLLMIFPVLIGLTSPVFELTAMFPGQFLYPILTAVAIVLLVNVAVFPEFGSTHLGLVTIETLRQTLDVQKSASALFVASASNSLAPTDPSLRELTAAKSELRKKVAGCKAALVECSFELAFSVLAPRELRPIAGKGIRALVASTLSLVGACESEYALLGQLEHHEDDAGRGKSIEIPPDEANVNPLRRSRGISGDAELLRSLLRCVEQPLSELQSTLSRTIDVISACLAYTYDVPSLPFLTQNMHGILLQELDIHIDTLQSAIDDFGRTTTDALESATDLTELTPDEAGNVDVMPRDEVFLVSSFMLNLRQAATHTLEMLECARHLVELRKERRERRHLWFPRVKWRKWLFSGRSEQHVDAGCDGGDSDFGASRETLTRERRRAVRAGRTARERIADFLEWAAGSQDVSYAFKLTIGVMLCSWPAFVEEWAPWFFRSRGVWVGLVFILVFENAVGSTIWVFALRTAGTVVGSVWGYAAYKAHNGNEVVIAVMIMAGTVPSYYVQLGTKYMKAGMICTISMCVVAVSTHLQTVPGSPEENFYKRAVTMLIGGGVATLVQMVILPAKARVKLRESLATAIVEINKMETCIALGVDETKNIVSSPRLFKKFARASRKAEASLASAETFLEYTKHEPRLKGGFEMQEVVYKEIIFVLRQIVDRMENLLQMRQAYGSAVLEQYNARVYSYRRNVAASITLMLFACHEALTTKLPLPQFLPSARIAHVRMVVRVRQILMEEEDEQARETGMSPPALAKRRALRLKFLSWNAATAALEECIEYVEELVDLMKMLVGANEFRSGLLNRPTYREYVRQIRQARDGRLRESAKVEAGTGAGAGAREDAPETLAVSGTSLRRLTSRMMGASMREEETETEDLPNPLQRIQGRKAATARFGMVKSGVIGGRGVKE